VKTPEQYRLAFIDVETTSLDRDKRYPWEVGAIVRDLDGTHTSFDMMIEVPPGVLAEADPQSLMIGGFEDRHPRGARYDPHVRGPIEATRPLYAAQHIAGWTTSAVLIGKNPQFDEHTLWRFLTGCGIEPRWHYRLVNVDDMARAILGTPAGVKIDYEALGVTADPSAHQAYADARLAMAIYDRCRDLQHDRWLEDPNS
jgi:hypothetical protein